MSRHHDRHEGVSCDGCHAENFRCARYKCLVCFDYDLCARCFEAGTTTQRHIPDHPMQCILTRADHELYYGGESIPTDQPQSFACPFCRILGFTETGLQEHVAAEHSDASGEVVCPVCAATPSGEPNHMTDDLASHLTVDHLRRNEFSHEESRLQRRVPPSAVVRGGGVGTAMLSRGRGRGHHAAAAAAAAGLSAFARDSSDPIAELLSQLGGIRRAGASAVSQIQQLQQQVSRQAPRRTIITTIEAGGTGAAADTPSNAPGATPEPAAFVPSGSWGTTVTSEDLSRLLLPTLFERSLPEEENMSLDVERSNRSLFVQELLLSTLTRREQQRSAGPVEDGVEKNTKANSKQSTVANKRSSGSGDSNKHASDTSGNSVMTNGPHYAENGASASDGGNSTPTSASSTRLGSANTQITSSSAQTRAVVQTTTPPVRVSATMQRPVPQQPQAAPAAPAAAPPTVQQGQQQRAGDENGAAGGQ